MHTNAALLANQLRNNIRDNLPQEDTVSVVELVTKFAARSETSLLSTSGVNTFTFFEQQHFIKDSISFSNDLTTEMLNQAGNLRRLQEIHCTCNNTTVVGMLQSKCRALWNIVPQSVKEKLPWSEQYIFSTTPDPATTPAPATTPPVIDTTNIDKLKTETMEKLSILQANIERATAIGFLLTAIASSASTQNMWNGTKVLLNDISANFPAKNAELQAVHNLLIGCENMLQPLITATIPQSTDLLPTLFVFYNDLQSAWNRLQLVAQWVIGKIQVVEIRRNEHQYSTGVNALQTLSSALSGYGMVTALAQNLTYFTSALHLMNSGVHFTATWKCGDVLKELNRMNTLCLERSQQIMNLKDEMLRFLLRLQPVPNTAQKKCRMNFGF